MKRYLTGNTRYRVHKPLFGKPLVVLQVEETTSGDIYCVSGVIDTLPQYSTWRDATFEDISTTDNNLKAPCAIK